MRIFKRFPFIRQFDSSDCALACIKMLCKYYNINDNSEIDDYVSYISNDGISLEAVVELARRNEFHAECGKIDLKNLVESTIQPCILYWNKNHYVVLYKVIKGKKLYFKLADPAKGKIIVPLEEFKKSWIIGNNKNDSYGIVIVLHPNTTNNQENKYINKKSNSQISILPFIRNDRKTFSFIILGTFLGCIIQLIFPFLTQAIVDKGINNQKIELVIAILLGQFLLIIGNLITDSFRRWMTLKFGYKFSKELFANLIKKLLKLPIQFFDSKHIGDFLQRFQDHDKIERFITNHIVNFTFSLISLLVLGLVLISFNFSMFCVFSIGSALYIVWTLLFINRKKNINQTIFYLKSKSQSKYHELIKGISDIKLHNYHDTHLRQISEIQNKLYENNIMNLRTDQKIESGNIFINEFKNLIITFISSYLVIKNELTLGTMLSVQYIIGQLNVPINQLIVFINNYPDAMLSLERLNDILAKKDEATGLKDPTSNNNIVLKNVSFKYLITGENVLNKINLVIPSGKTTAIVGSSGSGKTTLVKLLLKMYKPTNGNIMCGDFDLENIKSRAWYENCGAVLQDSYIFADSIVKNIIMDKDFNKQNFNNSIRIANIESFINQLPFKYNTQIGDGGMNLSQGQKQRILIARAIYKNPKLLFFDEATNALDAKNERIIVDNLSTYLVNKTAIIVAHRLSTVRNADLIIVMNQGVIVERGTHETLVQKKGFYYELIKNQLELGN